MEFSEGRNANCKGGWHWLAEIQKTHQWDQLGSQGCIMAHVIAPRVRQNETEFTMSVSDMRRAIGCTDRKRTRCSVGQVGTKQLADAGWLQTTEQADCYRVVMPDVCSQNARTSNVPGTSDVPNGTFHVPTGTSDVPNGTFHVPTYKVVEREKKTGEGETRVIADALLDIYPPTRRTSPHDFARHFAAAVRAWQVRHGGEWDEVARRVGARARAHIEAHKASGGEDRFFPMPRRFFDERIEAEPPVVTTPESEREARLARLSELVGDIP